MAKRRRPASCSPMASGVPVSLGESDVRARGEPFIRAGPPRPVVSSEPLSAGYGCCERWSVMFHNLANHDMMCHNCKDDRTSSHT